MKYNSYHIEKQTKIENGTFVEDGYNVYAPFNKTNVVHHCNSTQEAKAWVDSQISQVDPTRKRYTPVHYSQYYWTVADNHNGGIYVRKEDGKLLLFHKREQAFNWCVENN